MRQPPRHEQPDTSPSSADAFERAGVRLGDLIGGRPSTQPVVRQRHPADDDVLDGVVTYTPSGGQLATRQPAEAELAADAAEPVPGREPIAARLLRILGLGGGEEALVPAVYVPCAACRDERRRTPAGVFPEAVARVEISLGHAPIGEAALCHEHQVVLRHEGAQLRPRSLLQPPPPRRPTDVYRIAYQYPKPPPVPFAPIPVPNTPVLAISGDYTGQLAASLSSAAVSLPGPRQRRALT